LESVDSSRSSHRYQVALALYSTLACLFAVSSSVLVSRVKIYPGILLASFLTVVLLGVLNYLVLHVVTAADQKRLYLALAVAFLIRVAWGFGVYYWSLANGGIGTLTDADDRVYDYYGWLVAQSWRRGQFDVGRIPLSHTGFVYAVAAIYTLIGHNIPAVVVTNSFLSVGTAILTYDIAAQLYGDRRVSRLALLLTAFFPPLVYYGGFFHKEALIIFLMTFVAREGLKLRTGAKGGKANVHLLCAAIALLMLYTLRRAFAVIGFAIVFMYLLLRLKDMSLHKRLFDAAMLLTFVGVGLVFARVPLGGVEGSFGGDVLFYSSHLPSNIREYVAAHPDSLFRIFATRTSIVERAYLLPVAVIYSVIIPFPPWADVGTWHGNVLVRMNIAWIVLVPFAFYGIVHSMRRERTRSFFVYGLVASVVLALAIGYVGAIERYRNAVQPLNMVFAALGLVHYDRARRWAAGWFVAYMMGILLYVILKSHSDLVMKSLLYGVALAALASGLGVWIKRRL